MLSNELHSLERVNMLNLSILVCLLVCWIGVTKGDHCDVSVGDKFDCGEYETQQAECELKGCCWQPVAKKQSQKGIPWCFYPSDVTHPPSPCDDMIWYAPDAGFTQDYYNIMYENYKNNLNVEGVGAVVAAPDQETPGGSYYYHWMRDAGLSIKAWMDINDNDFSLCEEAVDGYAKWVAKVQKKPDPNEIDVRIEPKFTIPEGNPYTGGWCRPQTDGPALRAMAMSKWGTILLANGDGARAASEIWPLVSFDMAWVTENWASNGCDLWEEVESSDFYWNRMAMVYSLNEAAKFADLIGEDGTEYRTAANEIAISVTAHWNGDFIHESQNRQQDGSVIHAISTFGEYLFAPNSEEAAGTIHTLTKTFCYEYPINQDDNTALIPGILIGRYPGDSYAGGNPWQLLCAVLAEVFYVAASLTLKSIETRGNYELSFEENANWIKLLKLEHDSTAYDLYAKQYSAGDAVMTRLWEHVQDKGGVIDEQIDKHTGKQASASGLTWSYANILHTLYTRKNIPPPDPSDTTTKKPGPTSNPTGPTQPGTTANPGSTTPPKTCCNGVKFESTGGIAANFPGIVGSYKKTTTDSTGRSVYKMPGTDNYLHYVVDHMYHFEAWIFSASVSDTTGEVINLDKNQCGDATTPTWEFLKNEEWHVDETARVTCDESTADCCNGLILTSTGGIADSYPDLLGTYREYIKDTTSGSHPVYKNGDNYLYFLKDVPHHFAGWTIAQGFDQLGPISNMAETDCVETADAAWEYIDENGAWAEDSTLTLECAEISDCCEKVTLSSNGAAKDKYPQLMGDYQHAGSENARPLYVGANSNLHYHKDLLHHWEGWIVGKGAGDLYYDDTKACPSDLGTAWNVANGNGWLVDETLTITCG